MCFGAVFVHFLKRNMIFILTNIHEPFKTESIYIGNIIVNELKIWPGWKEHYGVIANYQWKSQPNVLRKIEIGNDKVVTFKDISEAFNVELNRSSVGPTIASLNCKEGRVTLYLKPETQLTNVKISEDIARELKIKTDRSNTPANLSTLTRSPSTTSTISI